MLIHLVSCKVNTDVTNATNNKVTVYSSSVHVQILSMYIIRGRAWWVKQVVGCHRNNDNERYVS